MHCLHLFSVPACALHSVLGPLPQFSLMLPNTQRLFTLGSVSQFPPAVFLLLLHPCT